ncbi:uncharacterized protein Eint_100890 [Encephalitozoon intestinalis ATCC 50506]|uniref:DNA replication complex GINS protein PSF1 n=1 Tax=Encephalitozoon intestinalis (strain ATCC 50506) TaxID=876142 RepID=E0S9N0_ENCIT|nr:uncharacterized protein Eint_100890 [Encephalitozoon intestinalis ATCC 50506]ADM12415.1 hypothetical protein Eint_100890 [Encephalitozoon intestinalis ATCC 50506]UTX46249.1 putative DNA replication complex GINS protein PSF1 [Encephalitozoon intestinalis]
MIFGEAGTWLLEDLKSSVLKPYRHAEIKAIQGENGDLDKKMEEIRRAAGSGISEELSVNYVMMKHFKERNERIVRSYKFHRILGLFDCFFGRKETSGILSPEEEECAEEYYATLKEYLEPFADMDFTTETPPTQFFVQVITLEDCGVVMDEGDLIELKKDRIYFIKKSSIAHLISDGLVRII